MHIWHGRLAAERQQRARHRLPGVPGRRRWWGAFADGPVFATTAVLGLMQITLEPGLYLAPAAGVARAGTWFRRPRIRNRLEAVSGTVLVALGLRMAASGH
jgi:threonine/homoserine/homoserine lactone efflux protein